MTVREGNGGAERTLEPLLLKHRLGGSASAQIAFKLVPDALEEDSRALETHEYFGRRVVAILPERWTITRSRVRAYVDIIELERRAGLTFGPERLPSLGPLREQWSLQTTAALRLDFKAPSSIPALTPFGHLAVLLTQPALLRGDTRPAALGSYAHTLVGAKPLISRPMANSKSMRSF
jgi:hypothetical protein